MNKSIEARVDALLAEVESPRNLKDRCAFAISHQPELVACIRDLLKFIAGQHLASTTLALKASRLVVALGPLLTRPRPGGRHLIDDYVEGAAPKLRAAYDELKRDLEQQ